MEKKNITIRIFDYFANTNLLTKFSRIIIQSYSNLLAEIDKLGYKSVIIFLTPEKYEKIKHIKRKSYLINLFLLLEYLIKNNENQNLNKICYNCNKNICKYIIIVNKDIILSCDECKSELINKLLNNKEKFEIIERGKLI